MRKRLGDAALMSFLDLISCGLGAALLLFLIAATATPVIQPEERNESVLVISRHLGGPRAEVGLQWRVEGEDRWNRDAEGESAVLSVPSSVNSGGEAVLILQNSRAGLIEVQPYLRSFPTIQQAGDDQEGQGTQVTLDVLGRGAAIETPESEPVPLLWPGRGGQIVRIRLERSENY